MRRCAGSGPRPPPSSQTLKRTLSERVARVQQRERELAEALARVEKREQKLDAADERGSRLESVRLRLAEAKEAAPPRAARARRRAELALDAELDAREQALASARPLRETCCFNTSSAGRRRARSSPPEKSSTRARS